MYGVHVQRERGRKTHNHQIFSLTHTYLHNMLMRYKMSEAEANLIHKMCLYNFVMSKRKQAAKSVGKQHQQ